MKESKRRPARLKGVVLVMVVTLLFVLIVMLMATLPPPRAHALLIYFKERTGKNVTELS